MTKEKKESLFRGIGKKKIFFVFSWTKSVLVELIMYSLLKTILKFCTYHRIHTYIHTYIYIYIYIYNILCLCMYNFVYVYIYIYVYIYRERDRERNVQKFPAKKKDTFQLYAHPLKKNRIFCMQFLFALPNNFFLCVCVCVCVCVFYYFSGFFVLPYYMFHFFFLFTLLFIITYYSYYIYIILYYYYFIFLHYF